jgi:hypothetical protein
MKDSKKSDILSSQFILPIGNNPLRRIETIFTKSIIK